MAALHPVRFIVTADDLGLNAAATTAVISSLAQGLVSHASLLVNLTGFEEACERARRARVQRRIGLHLNLTEGPPLTDAIRRTPLCAGGEFLPHDRFPRYRLLSSATRCAVAEEARAQIAAARAQGFRLTHLDSHNDVHTAPGIADVVIAIARASEIARVRPARNCGARQGTIRWIQHHVYNVLLNRQGLKQVMYFGTTDDMLWLAGKGRLGSGSSAEVMMHPRLSAEGVVVDAPSMKPLAECLRELGSHPVTRVRAAG